MSACFLLTKLVQIPLLLHAIPVTPKPCCCKYPNSFVLENKLSSQTIYSKSGSLFKSNSSRCGTVAAVLFFLSAFGIFPILTGPEPFKCRSHDNKSVFKLLPSPYI
jgi:hypothetical protein